MKKIIFILFSLLLFFGCAPSLYYYYRYYPNYDFRNPDKIRDIKVNDINIGIYISNNVKSYLFAFIPKQFSTKSELVISTEGLEKSEDLKINSYIIKVNNEKNIEKKKNMKIKIYKKGKYTGYHIPFKNIYKDRDVITILINMTIYNNGKTINKIIQKNFYLKKEIKLDLDCINLVQ